MLQLSGMLINRPILSLRTGGPVGSVTAPIINPNNLKIEGFYCQGRKQLILLPQDIREVLPQGLVVNDQDVLSEAEDLVRLRSVMAINFALLGKHVETTGKRKLGKIDDYATETDSMFIKKLYISPPLLKSFNGTSLIIDRTQIVEITDKKVVVNDSEAKVPAHAGAVAA